MRWYRPVFVMPGGDEEGKGAVGDLVTPQRPTIMLMGNQWVGLKKPKSPHIEHGGVRCDYRRSALHEET